MDQLSSTRDQRPSETARGTRKTTNVFNVVEYPVWHVTFLSAIQQVLANIGAQMTNAYIISRNLCARDPDVLFANLLSVSLFMSGLASVLQVTFGVRLPAVQSASSSFLPVIMAMMRTPEWQCPVLYNNGTSDNSTPASLSDEEIWQPRLMELSGSLAVASCIQIFLGCSGMLGFLMNFIGPMTIVPTVALVGLSLYGGLIGGAAQQWGITMMTLGLLIIFSLILGNVEVPFALYNKQKGCYTSKHSFFRLFPHMLSIGITWLFCYILTITDVFPSDPDALGYYARTDAKTHIIDKMDWWFFPYPGRWGKLTIGPGVVAGMFGAILASTIESLGTFYATANICDAPPPPKHAVNRGIAMEGLGTLISAVIGAGYGTTCYPTTVGDISITRVPCRIIWQLFGSFIMVFGCIGKLGAALSIIPEPIIAGVSISSFGMIISVGMSNMQYIDMNSSRNLLILGVSFMLGMMVPTWLNENPGIINTGNTDADQVFTVLLSTGMLVGGLVACFLDNVIPGTRTERGIGAYLDRANASRADISQQNGIRNKSQDNSDISSVSGCSVELSSEVDEEAFDYSIYDLPYVSDAMRRTKWCTYIPFFPSYIDRPWCKNSKCCSKNKAESSSELDESSLGKNVSADIKKARRSTEGNTSSITNSLTRGDIFKGDDNAAFESEESSYF